MPWLFVECILYTKTILMAFGFVLYTFYVLFLWKIISLSNFYFNTKEGYYYHMDFYKSLRFTNYYPFFLTLMIFEIIQNWKSLFDSTSLSWIWKWCWEVILVLIYLNIFSVFPFPWPPIDSIPSPTNNYVS